MISRVGSLATGKLADSPWASLQIVDRPKSSIIPNHPSHLEPQHPSLKSVIQSVAELPSKISKLINQIDNPIAPEVIRQIRDRPAKISINRRNQQQQPKNLLVINRIRRRVQFINPFSRHSFKKGSIE